VGHPSSDAKVVIVMPAWRADPAVVSHSNLVFEAGGKGAWFGRRDKQRLHRSRAHGGTGFHTHVSLSSLNKTHGRRGLTLCFALLRSRSHDARTRRSACEADPFQKVVQRGRCVRLTSTRLCQCRLKLILHNRSCASSASPCAASPLLVNRLSFVFYYSRTSSGPRTSPSTTAHTAFR
jgi:hypothetical protein